MTSAPDDPAVHAFSGWLADNRDRIVDELSDWVRIPSVAGDERREADVERSARWLVGRLHDVGFPIVEVWPTESGPPAVFAHWQVAESAPTVLVYSHHDVRAVKAEDWSVTQPFRPVLRGSRLYGRGASDAKGQVLAHLWGLRALLASREHAAPPVNLSLLIDGEEELGSPGLAALLDEHAEQIRADLVLLSDTMTWAADRPAVCVGNRGMMKAHVEIRAAQADTHAGASAGAAPNPADELVRVLAALHDEHRRVTIPGFYDDVDEPRKKERKAIARLTADAADWARRTGRRAVRGEHERGLGELLYTRPAVEVMVLRSGDGDPPTTGTMPSVAGADLDISLVPHQDPDTITTQLQTWLSAQVSEEFDADVTVDATINQPAYLTPRDHPVLDVLAECMASAWGCEVGVMRNAGGAPTRLLADAVGAPVAFFGTGLPEDAWHGPDESVDVDVLVKGAATMALFWPRLAARIAPSAG